MGNKNIQLIHKEQNEECFEIIKSTIVEDKELKKYRIDKDTLLHELPESIVNEFLDFLGTDEQHRNLMLHLIKTGSLVMNCWEDQNEDKSKNKFTNTKEGYDRQVRLDPKSYGLFDDDNGNGLPF